MPNELPQKIEKLILDKRDWYKKNHGVDWDADWQKWTAKDWAYFIEELSDDQPEMAKAIFETIKEEMTVSYKGFSAFEPPNLGGTEAFYGDEQSYEDGCFARIVTVADLVDYFYYHPWSDRKQEFLALWQRLAPTPKQSVGGENDNCTRLVELEGKHIQFLAVYWQSIANASMDDWLSGHAWCDISADEFSDARSGAVVLLRGIAQEKMRAIVRADRTFNHVHIT